MIGNIFVFLFVVVMAYAIYSAPRHKRHQQDARAESVRLYYRLVIPKNKPDGTVLSEAEHEALVAQAVAEVEAHQQRYHRPIVMTKTDMIYKLSNDVAAVRSLLEEERGQTMTPQLSKENK